MQRSAPKVWNHGRICSTLLLTTHRNGWRNITCDQYPKPSSNDEEEDACKDKEKASSEKEGVRDTENQHA